MAPPDDEVLPSTVKAYTGLLTTGVFIIGLFVNLLSIFSVSCYHKTSTKVLYLITVNLFISNLVLDIFYFPVTGLHIIQNWPDWGYSGKLCEWASLSDNACTTVIVLSLLLLTCDRYFVTVEKKALPVKAIVLFSVLIWVLSLCLHGTYSFSANPQQMEFQGRNISVCNAFIGEPLSPETSNYSTAAIGNLTCLFIALVLILRTGVFIWRGKLRGPVKTKKYIKQEFKIALIVIVFSWLFLLPKWVIYIVRGNGTPVESRIAILAHVIGSLNSIIPGIICLMFSKDFRRSFLDILRGCKGSTLCMSPEQRKKDGLKEPLTQPNKRQYLEIATPPTFVKGEFKSCSNDLDLNRVSIDSSTLEDHAGPGLKNETYATSTLESEIFAQIDSKF